MSQEQPNRPDNRPPRWGGRPPGPGGDDPNQPPKKGPRFSIYWIYAIIFAVLIGFQLFGPFSRNMAKTDELELTSMVAAGYVSEYVVVDNRKTVKVYLTDASQMKQAVIPKKCSGKISKQAQHMHLKITS